MPFKKKYNTPLPDEKKQDFYRWVFNQSKRQGRNVLNDVWSYDVTGYYLSGDWKRPSDVPVRQKLYPTEVEYFRDNPHVAGMAAGDNTVILNPFSTLKDTEKHAVIRNEQFRVYMRERDIEPDFELTDEQREKFKNYGDDKSIKQTIAARIYSSDPSAGLPTQDQLRFLQDVFTLHGTDKFKKPNHPTFSNESIYHGKNGFTGGKWEKTKDGWDFYPSTTNRQFMNIPTLKNYLRASGDYDVRVRH